jgi:uncharacterized membrane protein
LKTALRWLFRNPAFYINIMPPYLPWQREHVAISGVAEA